MDKTNLKELRVDQADTAWVLVSTALVFVMIPGLGHFYGGMTRNKHKLSVFLSTMFSASIICIQWFLCGFSLSFSSTGSFFIGNFDHAVLRNVGDAPTELAPTIPHNAFMLFQCMFAVITPALAFGCVAERATIRGFLVFMIFWSVLVYNFVTYWIWSTHGWLKQFGTIDFAGGIVVHVVAGFSALAYSLYIGPREGFKRKKFPVVNIQDVFIGTGLLWFGWTGFNGGSAYAINSRTVNCVVVSNFAAAAGAISWLFTEMIIERNVKISLYGFCNGAIAGLACVTPGAGYISPSSSLIFGVLAGPICVFGSKLKDIKRLKFDDPCDVFGVHAVAGILGSLLTAIFADNAVVTMAGDPPIKGGVVDGNNQQLLAQFVGICAAAGWSFVMTLIILKAISYIPSLRLRLNEMEERLGTDITDLGERHHSIVDFDNMSESWKTTSGKHATQTPQGKLRSLFQSLNPFTNNNENENTRARKVPIVYFQDSDNAQNDEQQQSNGLNIQNEQQEDEDLITNVKDEI